MRWRHVGPANEGQALRDWHRRQTLPGLVEALAERPPELLRPGHLSAPLCIATLIERDNQAEQRIRELREAMDHARRVLGWRGTLRAKRILDAALSDPPAFDTPKSEREREKQTGAWGLP